MPRSQIQTDQGEGKFIEEDELLNNPPYSFTYADTTARTSATGLDASDHGKIARQLDDDSLWMLLNHAPLTWKNIGAAVTPTIIVQDDGITVPGGPHDTLNFTGGAAITDGGGGTANIATHTRAHSIHSTDDHSDAPATPPTDGQILYWVASAAKYVAKLPALIFQLLGAPLANGPHHTLNVLGQGNTIADAGSGVANLTIHGRSHSIHGVSDHSDAPTVAPTDGQLLKWSQSAGRYEAATDESGASAQERPETTFLGDLMTYPNQGAFSGADDIQYTRVFLYEGTTMVAMEIFLEALPGSSDIILGLYNQTDPQDSSLTPNSKVAETASYTLVVGDVGKFVVRPLLANYLVPATGYYWVAFTGSATNTKYAASDTFRADYLPRYEEAGGGTLPATVGTISNPQGAVLFAAVVRDVS